jgi:hypothetical protein
MPSRPGGRGGKQNRRTPHENAGRHRDAGGQKVLDRINGPSCAYASLPLQEPKVTPTPFRKLPDGSFEGAPASEPGVTTMLAYVRLGAVVGEP